MGLANDIGRRAVHAMVPFLAVAAVTYFGYHAVQGDRGLIAWFRLTQQIAHAESSLHALAAERHELQRSIRLLGPGQLDRDLLDERARMVLGLAHPEELIVLYPY